MGPGAWVRGSDSTAVIWSIDPTQAARGVVGSDPNSRLGSFSSGHATVTRHQRWLGYSQGEPCEQWECQFTCTVGRSLRYRDPLSCPMAGVWRCGAYCPVGHRFGVRESVRDHAIRGEVHSLPTLGGRGWGKRRLAEGTTMGRSCGGGAGAIGGGGGLISLFVLVFVVLASSSGRAGASYEDTDLGSIRVVFQVILIPRFSRSHRLEMHGSFLSVHLRCHGDVPVRSNDVGLRRFSSVLCLLLF